MTVTTTFLYNSFIIFLGQIPRSSISGSKGMTILKALNFYCLQKGQSSLCQGCLRPGVSTPPSKVDIAWELFRPDHSEKLLLLCNPLPLGNHKFVLCAHEFVSVLQTGSFVRLPI